MPENEEMDITPRSQRNPSFTTEEVISLLNIIEQYKNIIYNRSLNLTTTKAKAVAWKKIAQDFNRMYNSDRTAECCKIKWDNVKKNARKISKDVFDNKPDCDANVVTTKVIQMLTEAETSTFELPEEFVNNLEENIDAKLTGTDEESGSSHRKRDSNFMPHECSLLLQCARVEKKYLFCKKTTTRSNTLKNLAWERITENFNKRNSRQRSMKTLQTKFYNIRKSTKKIDDNKCDAKSNSTPIKENSITIKQQIKEEPFDNSEMDDDSHDDDSVDGKSNGYSISDPLSTVLNGNDDDIFYNNNSMQAENTEISKLKMELLKYKMETAKLERQRIEEALSAERSERESRSLETALRLRAARLELVAAENKLPLNHPALTYTNEEIPARGLMFS